MQFSAGAPTASATVSPGNVEKATPEQVAALRPRDDDDRTINGEEVLFVGMYELCVEIRNQHTSLFVFQAGLTRPPLPRPPVSYTVDFCHF